MAFDPVDLYTFADKGGQEVPAQQLDSNFTALLNAISEVDESITASIARAILVPVSESGITIPNIATRKNGLLGFGNDGSAVAVSYASLAANLGVLSTIGDLQASTNAGTFSQVLVAGYSTPGDCGVTGILFIPTTQPTTNPGVWQSADGHKWIIANSPVNPAMFGAVFNGTTDDGPAFQKAFDFAAANGVNTVNCPFAKTKINSSLSLDYSLVQFVGMGVDIDNTAGSGAFLTLTGSQFTSAVRTIEGFIVRGPGHAIAGRQFIKMGTDASSNQATLRNILVYDFYNDLYFISYPSFIDVYDCTFSRNLSPGGAESAVGYSIYFDPSVTQGPEQIRFMNCQWTTRQRIMKTTTNGEFRFIACSFDGWQQRLFDCQSTLNGGIEFWLCHWEISTNNGTYDADYVMYFVGYRVNYHGGVVLYQGPMINHSLIYSQADGSEVTGVGLYNNITFQQDNTTGTTNALAPVITGGGWIRGAIDAVLYQNGFRQIVTDSPTANMMPYGDFESDAWSSVWVASSHGADQTLTRDSTNPHSGTTSLKVHFPAGSSNAFYTGGVMMPIRPGQIPLCQFWARTVGLTGSGSQFLLNVAYADKAGNAMFSGAVAIIEQTTDLTPWTLFARSATLPAPPGACYSYFYLQVGFNSPHDVDLFIDDISVNHSG